MDLACPFFVPTEKWEGGTWMHPSRLPLGAGWKGLCSAPGHDGTQPTQDEVRDLCNLGYAINCSRLPKARKHDAVRFSVAKECGTQLVVTFVCEAAHLPVEHGQLLYDFSLGQWISAHSDSGIQKMAECYVQTYQLRNAVPEDRTASTNS